MRRQPPKIVSNGDPTFGGGPPYVSIESDEIEGRTFGN